MKLSDHLIKQTLNPEWDKATEVHDWRNYASDEIKNIWSSFTEVQKLAIIEMLDDQASNEDWD